MNGEPGDGGEAGLARGFACVWCDYELTGAGETGTCPECGRWYDKVRDGEWVRRVMVRLLWCIGIGAILMHLAPYFQELVTLREGQQRTQNGPLLFILGRLMVAAGVAFAGVVSGRSLAERAWPVVMAVVYSAVELLVLRQWALPRYNDTESYGEALTPEWWASQVGPIRGFAAAGMAIATATVLRRVIRGMAVLRVLGSIVFWLAVAAIAVEAVATVQQWTLIQTTFSYKRSSTPLPSGALPLTPDGPLPVYFRSPAFSGVLRWVYSSVMVVVWVGAGLAALMAAGLVGHEPAESRRSAGPSGGACTAEGGNCRSGKLPKPGNGASAD